MALNGALHSANKKEVMKMRLRVGEDASNDLRCHFAGVEPLIGIRR